MAVALTGSSDPGFFETLGVAPIPLPGRRDEAWRFTALDRLTGRRFHPAPVTSPVPTLAVIPDLEADRIVIVNGRVSPQLSTIGALPAGAFVGALTDAPQELPAGVDFAFARLNAGLTEGGFALVLDDGVILPRPVHILHWTEGEGIAIHPRGLIRLGRGASATVIESFAGSGLYWTNQASTVTIGEGATLRHHRLQDEASTAFHTADLGVTIGAKATYDGFLLTLGADLARQDMRAVLAGDRGFCGFSGAYLLDGRREATIASVIRHANTNGRTKEVFKGCLADRSHGVFQGRLEVAVDAQKTDAHQSSKTMLLGERAVMDAKPELEIFADDVKCSHGATVGDLDETQLFYLRSRGITPVVARRMLIEAFVADAIDLIENEPVRAWFRQALDARLQGIGDLK
jgi:Fe-S cluster assembly protein SufD